MKNKILSLLLTVLMLLSCVVMAEAKSVDIDKEVLQVKEEIIESLPQEMKGKTYVISEGEAKNGENRSLVAVEDCSPKTIQMLVDEGHIAEADTKVDPGVTIEVKEITGISPFVENENGVIVNALSNRAVSNSWSSTSSWWSDTSNSHYMLYGKAYVYYYRYSISNESGTAYRPITFYAKYTANTSNMPTEMIATYGHPEVYKVSYPEYINGDSNTKTFINQYSATGSTSYPSAGTTYSYSTGMNSYCLLTNAYTTPGMTVKLYRNSSILCEGRMTFSDL